MTQATAASRIKHLVVLVLENRSFDHILGTLPGVEGVRFLDGSRLHAGATFEVASEAGRCRSLCTPDRQLPSSSSGLTSCSSRA